MVTSREITSRADARAKLPANWKEMTPEEKRRYRLNHFVSTEGRNFVSEKAEQAYKVRAKRLVDVFDIKEPDRVPVNLPVGNLPLIMAGVNSYSTFYDHEKAIEAYMKFNEQYSDELEYFATPNVSAGRALDIIDYKLYAWPGHGLPEDSYGWQYIEGEYMTEDEYDDFIRDPSDFWVRTYFPRVFGALEPIKAFRPFTEINENVHLGQLLGPLATPPVQGMLQKMLDAGKEYQKVTQLTARYAGMGISHGFPVMGSIFGKAPFDVIGDTLRGTRGIFRDMFKCPDKLLEALDVVADLTISHALKSPLFPSAVLTGYPLHKGADGWMSQQQFDKFYWPSMKKVMDALIKEGLIQRLFAEGGYESRLDYVKDFPKGTVTWHFDRTDMFKAKQVLGKKFCIQGNVPSAMTITGKPAEVKEYCRKLIEVCGKGGGFILTAGAVGNNAKLENLRAMMEAVREYGVYRR